MTIYKLKEEKAMLEEKIRLLLAEFEDNICNVDSVDIETTLMVSSKSIFIVNVKVSI